MVCRISSLINMALTSYLMLGSIFCFHLLMLFLFISVSNHYQIKITTNSILSLVLFHFKLFVNGFSVFFMFFSFWCFAFWNLNFFGLEGHVFQSLRGPRGGMIFFKKEPVLGIDLETAINNAVFPGLQVNLDSPSFPPLSILFPCSVIS